MPPMLPMRPLSSIAPKGGTKLRAEAITWLHAQVGGANGQAQIFPAIHLDTIHCIQIKLYSIHLGTQWTRIRLETLGNNKDITRYQISVEQWINDKDIARDHSSPHRIKFHLAHANGSVRNHLVELGPVEGFRTAQHIWFGR